MDCIPPGSSVPGISQAWVGIGLEWVAISFSRVSSQPRDQTHVSCVSCIAGGFFTTETPRKLPDVEMSLILIKRYFSLTNSTPGWCRRLSSLPLVTPQCCILPVPRLEGIPKITGETWESAARGQGRVGLVPRCALSWSGDRGSFPGVLCHCWRLGGIKALARQSPCRSSF